MNWFNFYTPKARSEAFAEAEDVQVGTWFRLIVYCCEQENKGMIIGAKAWSERKWKGSCDVCRDIILADSPLWHFNVMGALCVADYPLAKEEEICAKRIAGKRTARARWGGKHSRNSHRKNSSANNSATRSANSLPNAEGEGEDKGEDKDITKPVVQLRVIAGANVHEK